MRLEINTNYWKICVNLMEGALVNFYSKIEMKWFYILTFLVICGLGCGPTDEISRIVRIANDNDTFGSGPCYPIHAPAEMSMTNLIGQAFQHAFPFPIGAGRTKVIEVRKVNILQWSYTAVLVDTQSGHKIVLLRFLNHNLWWSVVLNTNCTVTS